jgi:hypothetical protein
MARKCFATVSIRGVEPVASSQDVKLGEFHAVWKEGVSIGSDAGCTVALPGLAPMAARGVAASNHKLLYHLPEGTSLPLPPVTYPVRRFDERVDYREFQVGQYLIRFGEIYREE